jgi:histidyl-tRNA synthetase
MLSDKYDDDNDILKEIYRLSDQGGRDLGLRYDLTVPFAKFIALNKNNISFPFKRYEIAKVFRDGPVKVGRDREFTQCDADVTGIKGQYIEAELLSLFVSGFSKLGIDVIIKYNNRNLMNGLILESGVSKELLSSVTTIMDKIDKFTEKEINTFLEDISITKKQINNLNKYFRMSFSEIKETFKDTNNEYIKLGIIEIENLDNYLKGIGIADKCEFSISLARGQNYYTGNVFEVYERTGKIKCAIGSGGRYDKIVGNFINDGNEYPTVGISFGLSPIFELIKESDMFNEKSQTDIYIIPVNTEVESLKITNDIRNLGYNVEIEMENKKIKKSMEYANKEKIPYVIVIGEDEINNRKFKLKNMLDGKEYEILFDEIKKIEKVM